MKKRSNDYYLDGIRERNEEIVKDIYVTFFPKVNSFILKNNGQEHDSRDIFNKVIYQFTARLESDTIEIKSTFEAYLLVACKNLWRRELGKIEKRRVTNENVRELYYEERDMTQATLEQERWELFNEKLETISENCRIVLQMFFRKMSSKEIMEKMEYSSETTVRQRIFKCKAMLAKMVKSDNRYTELENL